MVRFDETTVSNMISTLENVEVHGSGNMARILGCIQVLKNALNEAKDNEETE